MLSYTQIKNINIPIIFEAKNDIPIIHLQLVFKYAGRAYEGDIAGLANMFARLLNEGSDKKFFNDLEFRAINLSANSGFDNFSISISCLKEHFNYALKKLNLLLTKPNFDEKLLNNLKIQALSELKAKNSDYDYLANRLLNKIVFDYKEFQSSIYGDEKSLKNINIKNLKDFYNIYLDLSNLIIIAGGDIKLNNLKNKLSIILNNINIGEKRKIKSFDFIAAPKDELIIKEESHQAYIYFASDFKININDEDLYLAKMALFVLGTGGFGSRILEEIRVKRGLAYSAYAIADIKPTYKRIFGYLQTKNENAKMAKELIKEIFDDFITHGITQNELELTKKFLLGSSPLAYESLEKRLNIEFDEFNKGFKIGHFKEELKKIKNVELNTINNYIKKHKEIAKLSFASVQNAK